MFDHYVFNYFNKPPAVVEHNDLPTMTQQHFTEECDINNILKKFIQTGFLDTIGPGVYADITDIGDYQTSLAAIRAADELFAQLPSAIRERFENNPALYMDFVHDPKNLEEGIELGIFQKNTQIIKKPDATPATEQSS